MRREAEEQARREAEQQAAREAEEQRTRDAEDASARTEPGSPAPPPDEAARRETLVKAEGGGDKNVAEAEVAEAVQAGGRVQPDPKVAPKANKDVATPDPPGQPPSPEPAPAAEAGEKIVNADLKDQAGVEAEPEAAPPESPESAQAADTTETEKEKA